MVQYEYIGQKLANNPPISPTHSISWLFMTLGHTACFVRQAKLLSIISFNCKFTNSFLSLRFFSYFKIPNVPNSRENSV